MKINQQGQGCIGHELLQLIAGVVRRSGLNQLRTAGGAGQGCLARFDHIGSEAVGAENV